MKKNTVLPAFLLLFFAVALTVAGQTPDPLMGTWKVNLAKSTYSPGPPPTNAGSSIWEALGGGQFKNTVVGVDAKGQTTRSEVVLKFDGADYPFKGSAAPNTTRSYKRTDGGNYDYVEKVTGKVRQTSRSVMAPDGKTRTVTSTGTTEQGQPFKNVLVWDKQ